MGGQPEAVPDRRQWFCWFGALIGTLWMTRNDGDCAQSVSDDSPRRRAAAVGINCIQALAASWAGTLCLTHRKGRCDGSCGRACLRRVGWQIRKLQGLCRHRPCRQVKHPGTKMMAAVPAPAPASSLVWPGLAWQHLLVTPAEMGCCSQLDSLSGLQRSVLHPNHVLNRQINRTCHD